MTAVRVIVDHSDLENSGTISHSSLDTYINATPYLIVSGAATRTPTSRALSQGSGITITDGGALGDIVISVTSSIVSAGTHRTLPHLVHLADVGGPFEGYSGALKDAGPMPFPTASIWWTDATRTKKIVQKLVTRNANMSPVTIQWQTFATDGVTVAESMTDAITYDGVYEVSRSRSTS